MPRTRFDKTPKHLKLGALISGTAAMMGKDVSALADILDCSPNTVRSRLRNPGDLTVDELGKLGRGLHIPIDELRQAIRY